MSASNDSSGLQQVVLAERGRLLRFLAARGAGDEAEDLLHELWQRVAAVPNAPIADALSYVFRAAENLMRDRRRSMVSRERRHHDWHDVHYQASEEARGERAVIARDQLRAVDATLEGLGSRAALVFRRFRLDGAGQAEIARDLGISLSSVEKDLQKAYQALARLKAELDAE